MLKLAVKKSFQSTPPARGATEQAGIFGLMFDISIHAPREGGDNEMKEYDPDLYNFNPRPPRGGRRT